MLPRLLALEVSRALPVHLLYLGVVDALGAPIRIDRVKVTPNTVSLVKKLVKVGSRVTYFFVFSARRVKVFIDKLLLSTAHD